MNEPLGQMSTASAEGVVRRQANDLRELNNGLEMQIARLESVQVRMYGQNEERLNPTTDSPPEPVRNDLEELQYQLSTFRELLEKLGSVTNVMVEL